MSGKRMFPQTIVNDREQFMVDGRPMSLVQYAHGEYGKFYWFGVYKVNGKWKKRYFGVNDPRPKYPRCIPQPEPTGLVWLYGLGWAERESNSYSQDGYRKRNMQG